MGRNDLVPIHFLAICAYIELRPRKLNLNGVLPWLRSGLEGERTAAPVMRTRFSS